ncbi:helix-hairpin-helix domain-containing protein [Rossellomorea aquimaris]|nr:helix-hairpin-helix domain-containing protein [Rossellomorea aquimaris]
MIAALGTAIVMFYFLNSSDGQPEGNGLNSMTIEAKDLEVEGGEAPSDKASEPVDESVYVDVKGEVKKPGLYEVKKGERLKSVIDRAGGFTAKADSKLINLAIKVTDEMLIYVPGEGEAAAQVPFIQENAASPGEDGKINLNEASQEDFETLPGIGPAKAAAFVQYRDENGPFTRIEDIKDISGIGDKTFEKLKELIFVQ